jgi:hypothetical protein
MVMSKFLTVLVTSAMIAAAALASASAGSFAVAAKAEKDKARTTSCRPVSTCTYDVNGRLMHCSVEMVCN